MGQFTVSDGKIESASGLTQEEMGDLQETIEVLNEMGLEEDK